MTRLLGMSDVAALGEVRTEYVITCKTQHHFGSFCV